MAAARHSRTVAARHSRTAAARHPRTAAARHPRTVAASILEQQQKLIFMKLSSLGYCIPKLYFITSLNIQYARQKKVTLLSRKLLRTPLENITKCVHDFLDSRDRVCSAWRLTLEMCIAMHQIAVQWTLAYPHSTYTNARIIRTAALVIT